MKRFRFKTYKNFSSVSKKLKNEFDEVAKNPWHQQRFQSDYFFIPNQYKMIRQYADTLFSDYTYEKFIQSLLIIAQKKFGCLSISRPWVSFYTDGCYQNFHADVPHGPFAYVYSLTSSKKFSGGETLLLKDFTLDYWKNYESSFGVETKDIMDRIHPHFNQLLVFDPKIPHAVERVSGVDNPIDSRIVIHGWFQEPIPQISGGLSQINPKKYLPELIMNLSQIFKSYISISGYIALKIQVDTSGNCRFVEILTNTLIDSQRNSTLTVLKKLKKICLSYKFPKNKQRSEIILPLLIQTGS